MKIILSTVLASALAISTVGSAFAQAQGTPGGTVGGGGSSAGAGAAGAAAGAAGAAGALGTTGLLIGLGGLLVVAALVSDSSSGSTTD